MCKVCQEMNLRVLTLDCQRNINTITVEVPTILLVNALLKIRSVLDISILIKGRQDGSMQSCKRWLSGSKPGDGASCD